MTNNIFFELVKEGLSTNHKWLPTQFIYDQTGSELFEEIMELEEYYVTQAEKDNLLRYASDMVDCFGSDSFNLVELGSGNGKKTKLLIEACLEKGKDFSFYPIDISKSAIDNLCTSLQSELPSCKQEGLVMDYFEGLNWLNKRNKRKNVVLFLGSNLGNFDRADQLSFLIKLQDNLNKGDLLFIGLDLVKDFKQIQIAYDDSQGVTAKFILNLVVRINKELKGNFNLNSMRYYSFYNPRDKRNEAYVYSLIDQQIRIQDFETEISAFEPIHVEDSCKFDEEAIKKLSVESGFEQIASFKNKQLNFANEIWQK